MNLLKTTLTRHCQNGKVNIELSLTRNDPGQLDWETLVQINEPYVCVSMVGTCYDPHSDLRGSGQCLETVAAMFADDRTVQRVCQLWREWHLNNLMAGTKPQTEALQGFSYREYDGAKQFLSSRNLYIDRGYRYGSLWLARPLPAEVLTELGELFGCLDKIGPALEYARRPAKQGTMRIPGPMETRRVWVGAYGGHYAVAVVFTEKPVLDDCWLLTNEGIIAAKIPLCDFNNWFGTDVRADATEVRQVEPYDLTAVWDEYGSIVGLNTDVD